MRAIRDIQAIVAGGSAGALEALGQILPALPRDFRIPMALVVHVLPGRPSYLAEVLAAKSKVTVKEAEDKEPLAPATVYVAPPNYHLLIERKGYLSLSVDDPVHFSRPAIDVLFESAANAFGSSLFALLLSGANDDGARGLSYIKERGGTTIVQSPETATSRVMPESGIRVASPDYVLPLAEIGPFLARLCGGRAFSAEER